MGPSALLRAIRMCLRPKLDNSNNALASSEALGCASCHLLCLCIITILSNFRPNLRDRNQCAYSLNWIIVIMHSLRQKHSAAPRATYFTHALLLYYPILGRIWEAEINIFKNWGPQLRFGPSDCAYGLN